MKHLLSLLLFALPLSAQIFTFPPIRASKADPQPSWSVVLIDTKGGIRIAKLGANLTYDAASNEVRATWPVAPTVTVASVSGLGYVTVSGAQLPKRITTIAAVPANCSFLRVMVNGITLSEGIDYSITGGNIVAKPWPAGRYPAGAPDWDADPAPWAVADGDVVRVECHAR